MSQAQRDAIRALLRAQAAESPSLKAGAGGGSSGGSSARVSAARLHCLALGVDLQPDSQGRECVSLRGCARIVGVSHPAVLCALTQGRLKGERVTFAGVVYGQWRIPLAEVLGWRVHTKMQAIGGIRKGRR